MLQKIVIADPIPLLNKGEQALLEGIVESLQASFDKPQIVLLSRCSEQDKTRSRIPVIDRDATLFPTIKRIVRNRAFLFEGTMMALLMKLAGPYFRKLFSRSPLWDAVLASDIIIVGHDSSVSYDAIIIGSLLKKPLVIFAGSIENYRNKTNELIARMLLNKVRLITLREDDSYAAIKKMGVKAKTGVTADAAFLLKPCAPERVAEIMKKEGLQNHGKSLIGVTLTRQMCEKSLPNIDDIQKRYETAIVEKALVFDEMIERYNAQLIFIPHCIGPGKNDDRIVAEHIIGKMKRKDMAIPITVDLPASELKGLIGQCEIFIGERTHSVIAALSQGIPSICMTFPTDRRTHGIIGRMVEQREYVYNIEQLSHKDLLTLVDRLWIKRQQIRQELENIIPVIIQKANLNGQLVRDLAGKA